MGLDILAVTSGTLAVAIVWAYFREARRAKESSLCSRPEANLHEVYLLHFVGTGISEVEFSEAWRELAGMLEIPAERLLPSDRFAVELAPPRGYDYDDPVGGVRHVIAERCSRMNLDPNSIKTVRDYVVAFASFR
jgi:hypothetical protein